LKSRLLKAYKFAKNPLQPEQMLVFGTACLAQRRPLLIFSGNLSGKTKEINEKRLIKMQDYLIQMKKVK
jgi:hypothetical protein